MLAKKGLVKYVLILRISEKSQISEDFCSIPKCLRISFCSRVTAITLSLSTTAWKSTVIVLEATHIYPPSNSSFRVVAWLKVIVVFYRH